MLSIPAQRREIEKAFPDLNIIEWVEETKSAFHPGREEFGRIMQMFEDRKAEGLLAYYPNRLARNAQDAGTVCYRVRPEVGIIKDLRFASYRFYNDPDGIKALNNELSDSEHSSAQLSVVVKRGNGEHLELGFPNGQAIAGYRNERSAPGRDGYGTIVPDPEHWDMRRRMWDLKLSGLHSMARIQQIISAEGYRTKGNKRHPSGEISVTGLYLMYKNIRYAGLIPIPGKPGEFQKAAYPAMVTIEEFNKVQEMLGKKSFRRPVEPKPFAYRGAISCGKCNASVTAEEKTQIICTQCKKKFHLGKKTEACPSCGMLIKKMKNPTILNYKYYRCTGKKQPCQQSHKNVTEKELERQFGELLDRHTILPQFQEWALDVLKSQNEEVDAAAVLATQDRAIEALHAESKGLISMAAQKLISADEFKDSKAELDAKIKQLEKDRSDAAQRATDWYDEAERAFDLAVHGRERFINGDIDAKREVLAGLGQNLTLLGGKLHFEPHPWVALIENGYHELEAEYERVRTQNYDSAEQKTAAFAGVYNTWLGC